MPNALIKFKRTLIHEKMFYFHVKQMSILKVEISRVRYGIKFKNFILNYYVRLQLRVVDIEVERNDKDIHCHVILIK